jgi:KDO2-lipid IV(A) lauroyltransferase
MGMDAEKAHGPTVRCFLEYLIYLAFRLVEEAICLIPRDDTALAVGRFFGRIMFICGCERRKVTTENLSIAFGAQRSPADIRRLARANFEHPAMLGVEFFRLRRWDQDKLAEKLIIKGSDHFNVPWHPGKHGILYVSGHMGSFEVLAATSRFLGLRGNLIVTPGPNRFITKRMLFSRGGQESGLNILPHRGIVRSVIEALRRGEMVVVLADQRGDDSRPVWVDFFGRKVLANGVFAKFAVEGRCTVYPITAGRLSDGRYLFDFGAEIPIQVTDDTEADITVNSQRFHDLFEGWLRDCPEQGFWMHRKFKRKKKRSDARKLSRLQPTRVH